MFTNRKTCNDVCGLYLLNSSCESPFLSGLQQTRQCLPLSSLSAHATVLSTVSRTELTQTFHNTSPRPISARYIFPLYDGVSVVGFTCTINNDRVIRGSVQEKQKAREIFNNAVERGETAGLLEQLPDASDVFTTMVGNIPAGAEIKVDIIVLGELKHDAEVDGIRYTLPTCIAPRYGGSTLLSQPSPLQMGSNGLSITVDVEMQSNSIITSLTSPSHPIAIAIGSNSSDRSASNADTQNATKSSLATQVDTTMHQPQLASATLSLGAAFLDKDFVLQINATKITDPVAILESHPTIPDQRALMTTLVPRFNLPSERPEIVFVCDQSGSMQGQKNANLRSALQLFLKSLPVGVKFNICSFGSHHSFLFPEGSRTYDADSLDAAMQSVRGMQSNYGGTEIYSPIQDTFDKRDASLDLEVFVLTDGQVGNQNRIFDLVSSRQEQAKGAIRVFTLGIGDGASSALIEGLSRAGNGFAQTVSDSEKLDRKVIRMLKAALMPHISDYTIEIKFRNTQPTAPENEQRDDFELVAAIDLVDSSASSDSEDASAPTPHPHQDKPISLYDTSINPEENLEAPLNLPDVPFPKILQAPFQIPPLFPFNRTSIYMLLSPETAGREPVTVILRATSKHGPLTLDIPVMIPINPAGEVIHQLAARKAALELEEGRGWILHAKNDSLTLKEAYPREFHNMVEREAVRLGAKFQVGGKWCSFVAVDEGDRVFNTLSTHDNRASTRVSHFNIPEEAKQLSMDHQDTLFGSISSIVPNATRPHSISNVFGSARSDTQEQKSYVSLYDQPMSPSGSPFTQNPSSQTRPLASSSLFGGLMASKSPAAVGGDVGNGRLASVQSEAGGLFGSVPIAKPFYKMPGVVDGPEPLDNQAPSKPPGGLFGHHATHNPGDRRLRKVGMLGAQIKSRKAPTLNADVMQSFPPGVHETPLETIVRLQRFAGFWTSSDELCGAIGVNQDNLMKNEIKLSADAWTTMVVLAFMRRKLTVEKDVWELLEEKALAWLFTQVSSDDYAKIGDMIDGAGKLLN